MRLTCMHEHVTIRGMTNINEMRFSHERTYT
jgi:hypothetical protein